MSDKKQVKIIKKADVPKEQEPSTPPVAPDSRERHEIALLAALVRQHPVKAKFFLEQCTGRV